GFADLPRHGVAVLQHVDLGGRRRHPLGDDPAAEQRVDERALAGIELPDHDEQEQLVELLDRPIERLLMFGSRVEAAEGDAQPREDAALLLEELILRGGENLRQHSAFRCAGFGPRATQPDLLKSDRAWVHIIIHRPRWLSRPSWAKP